jgi:hypothetical protein
MRRVQIGSSWERFENAINSLIRLKMELESNGKVLDERQLMWLQTDLQSLSIFAEKFEIAMFDQPK